MRESAFNICENKGPDQLSGSRTVNLALYTPIPLDGVSATFRNFGQNDTKRGRNAKSVAETPRAQ